MINKPKNFADCYLYGIVNAEGGTVEKQLLDFLLNAQRINYADPAFAPIREALKSRVTSAVVYRMLEQGNIVLLLHNKELPATFKVFYAKDPKANKKHRVFVDVTGLIRFDNGQFYCKEIDKFSTYLLGVLAQEIYYNDTKALIRNGNIQKYSVSSFMKLAGGLMDFLRLTPYMQNRDRILYIFGVYFGYNVMRLDLSMARSVSMSMMHMSMNDAKSADYYYVAEDDFENIHTFITSLAKTFKMPQLTTDVFVERWLYLYGKGSHFALELYPVFLEMMLYAYSGTYINNWKRIEAATGKDMVDLATNILKIGGDMFNRGFTYESADTRQSAQNKAEQQEKLHESDDLPCIVKEKKLFNAHDISLCNMKTQHSAGETDIFKKAIADDILLKETEDFIEKLDHCSVAPVSLEEFCKLDLRQQQRIVDKCFLMEETIKNEKEAAKDAIDNKVVPEAGEKEMLVSELDKDNPMDV